MRTKDGCRVREPLFGRQGDVCPVLPADCTPRWTSRANTAVDGGVFDRSTTESDCKAENCIGRLVNMKQQSLTTQFRAI